MNYNLKNDTQESECLDVSTLIRAQGIDDLTSWISVQLIFGLVYSILFVLGIFGNGGVLIAVAQNKRLRSARNIFLLNLILTDLLLCLTGIPVTPWYALEKNWVFGPLMCRLMPLSNSCAVFVTSWSLTAIAIDKFIHIIDPTKEPFTVKQASVVTLLIWMICSLINIPYLLSYELVDGSYYMPKNATPFCGKFCDEINWNGETPRRLYGSSVMLLQFVVPMGIITKKRVNYILIAMVLAFICCWLPLTAVNIAKDFKKEPDFIRSQPYLWPLAAHAIAMSTVIWNPLLFFWLTRKQNKSSRSLGGILHTSEINTVNIVTSLASRVHSLKSLSSATNDNKLKRRNQNNNNNSDVNSLSKNNDRITSFMSRPLVVSNTENGHTKHVVMKSTSNML